MDFLIVVDQSGKHELRKGLVTVGMVNMHFPASVWDASATLSGYLRWVDPSETLTSSTAAFVRSLYVVPNKEKLMIVFRQPDDYEIVIRNLIVKRVSYHTCNVQGYEDVQLKVTEVKSLLFKVHPKDSKLYQGYESTKEDYEDIAREGQIHYELSLVHPGINKILAGNESLEVGEVTDAQATGTTLLDRSIIHSMLDSAVTMVSKIDFLGMHNFGTQPRLQVEETERLKAIQASLGPVGKSALPLVQAAASKITSGSFVNHAGQGGSSDMGSGNIPVHGVRMNTLAEIVENPDGFRYALGMGGAKVPVNQSQISSRTVMPDDSASQAGAAGTYFRPWSKNATSKGSGFW